MKLFDVIHEDDEMLVVNKPAGLVCHPTKGDEYSSLISRVRLHLGATSRPHLVNRLDRETSGVTMIAKTDEAALALRRIWESRNVRKTYLAIVHGAVSEQNGIIDAALGKDEQSHVAIKDCVRPDGLAARTAFQKEKVFSPECFLGSSVFSSGENSFREFTLLRVMPETGRKHQIRIHLAHIGHAIVGDKMYGGDEDLYLALVENRLTNDQKRRLILPFHALHAGMLTFQWNGAERAFAAEPEPWFRNFIEGHVPKIESELWPT